MNIAEINNEIANLENSDTNWTNIQKLSWLYTVREHMRIKTDNNCEFGIACQGIDTKRLVDILSEHMSVIKILHPKEYNEVIKRISEVSY